MGELEANTVADQSSDPYMRSCLLFVLTGQPVTYYMANHMTKIVVLHMVVVCGQPYDQNCVAAPSSDILGPLV